MTGGDGLEAARRRLRGSRRYREGKAAIRRQAETVGVVCGICGGAIDPSVSGHAPDGLSVDHFPISIDEAIELDLGDEIVNDLTNLRPSHRSCNLRDGARKGRAKQLRRDGGPPSGRGGFTRKKARPEAPSRPVVKKPPAGESWEYLQDRATVEAFEVGDGAAPRLLSPAGVDEAGSVGDALCDWAEEHFAVTLRPWQRSLSRRLFAVDADGHWVWHEAALSTPRQSGKSFWWRSMIAALLANPQLLPEPARMLLSASSLQQSGLLVHPLLPWSEDRGATVSRRTGQESISLPTGSLRVVAHASGLGHAANLLVIEEAHSVPVASFRDVLVPTLSGADSALTVAFSTAAPEPSAVFPDMRKRAAKPGSRTFLCEWSAAAGEDLDDVETYRRCSPTWSPTRQRLIESMLGTPEVVTQFGNVWPGDAAADVGPEWPRGLSACGRVTQPGPPANCVAVIEAGAERGDVAAAVGFRDGDGSVSVWTAPAGSLDEAVRMVVSWRPRQVLAGASVAEAVSTALAGEGVPVEGFRASAMTAATGAFAAAVAAGRLLHDHRDELLTQSRHVRMSRSEAGEALSVRRSTGPVSLVKAAALAAQRAIDAPAADAWLML